MAQVNPQISSTTGAAVTFQAADPAGDKFSNGGHTVFRVINGGVAAVNVTIKSPTLCNFGSNHDLVVSVPVGAAPFEIGPFAPGRFNDSNGNVSVTYASATSLQVAAVSS